MSGSEGARFLVRSFSATTVQTRKHHDRESSIQVDCPFRQHCSAAFIAGLHERTLSSREMEAYPSEVLGKGGLCDQMRLGLLGAD